MPTFFREDLKVPVIETERLRLRGHRPADFSACAALWADPIVTRYTVGKPLSEEEVWARMLRYAGHWAWMGFGFWLIEERATSSFVGEMGFADLRREMQPSLHGVPELGWVLAPPHHGKGYATECVRAALSWAEGMFTAEWRASGPPIAPELRFARTVCIIHPDNVRSIRVAAKCGFKEILRTSYKGEPNILFAQ
jgi:RimJ/RimL family protein N-acetyltransferase